MTGVPDWSVCKDYLHLNANQSIGLSTQLDSFIQNADAKKLAIEAIQGKVSHDCFKNLKAFAQSVAYDGFNPQTIILEMAKCALDDKTPPGEDFTFSFSGLTCSVSRKADLARDVQLLATLFLVRGNNLYKILKTVEKRAKEVIDLKRGTYKIKSDDDAQAAARKRKEKVILSSTDITLSRVAASFPHITLAIAKQCCIAGKAELAATKLTHQFTCDNHKQIPEVLQHGLLPALLSKSMPDNEIELRNFCYMFNLEQTITLQPVAVKKTMINESINTQMDQSVRFVVLFNTFYYTQRII